MTIKTNNTPDAGAGGVTEAMDLGGTTLGFMIPAQQGLDPVRVVMIDHEIGKGTLIVQCYNEAWTCYFGGMGERRLRQFVASVDRHYLSNALRVKNARYGERLANAIINECRDALRAAQPETSGGEG